MPAVPPVVAEKTPGMTVVLFLHQYPHTSTSYAIADVGPRCHVFFPDHGEEERTGTIHNRNVWQSPIAIISSEGLDDKEEERVTRYSAHGIVGYTCGGSLADPGGIREKRVKAAIATLATVSAVLPIEEPCVLVAI